MKFDSFVTDESRRTLHPQRRSFEDIGDLYSTRVTLHESETRNSSKHQRCTQENEHVEFNEASPKKTLDSK